MVFMAQEVLIGISIIIALSSLLTIIARIIKQPPIIAYLIAGVLVGPLALNIIGDNVSLIQTFARIGVAFLLFIVGLSLDFRLLREIGKVSTIVGIAQIALVGTLGYFIAIAMHFSFLSSLYIGLALAFSSTVVVVKILSDKKELDTLHGRIAIGILIVQDIVAAIALMILPLTDNLGAAREVVFREFGIAIGLILLIFLISTFIFRGLMDYLAKNQEALFLFGIAWALALATLFNYLGFSLELGALIAGMSLASSKYSLDLSGKMKPLRDFFIVLFFVFFGSQLSAINSSLILDAVLLSLFVMLAKPLIVMILLKIRGYKKKTNLLTSISLAQISEFSLILVLLGFSLGHLGAEVMNLIVLVTLITITTSTYFINYSDWLSRKLLRFLDIFDGKLEYNEDIKEKTYDIILFGYHRMGYKLLKSIKDLNESFLVVDYNPKVVVALNKQKINAIYGDAENKNFLYDIPLGKAKIILSTIPDENSNLTILEVLKESKSDAVFVSTAEQPRQALDLYKAGVDYVLIPHHLGGWYASELIKKNRTSKDKYRAIGKEHLKELNHARNNSSFE
jgi:Kef-type K+ transport system membrane component KefB